MALTEAQRFLINGLKACGVKTGMAAAIYMTVQTDDQMWEMCYYLADHRDAPAEKLLDAARIIAARAGAKEKETGSQVL